jgi:phosphoserine/homoserine phosphotransferase
MMSTPALIAFDLEGVFLPEIWIAVAEQTQLPALRRTTRDEPDYDRLMRYRMEILAREGLTLADIQAVIAAMTPLPGAVEFLDWARTQAPVVIITDSFYEFIAPFLPKLHYPTVFAHRLEVDDRGLLVDHKLRLLDGKRQAAQSFRALGFRVAAIGDSYNDTGMLAAADQGILFRPPANVIAEFPQFPVATNYVELQRLLTAFLAGASINAAL